VSAYTNLTADLWTWEPWRHLEHDSTDLVGRCTKLFWLSLYTSHDAKRVMPGLFAGSITTMAEAAGMPVDDSMRYLDRLLEHDLVEFDRESRVLRLTRLPGFGDAAGSNGKVIRGWWNQFKKVPACPVRDAHVATIRWMLDEWSRYTGKPLSNDHAQAWADTFGRVAIPAPRRRGVRRLVDSDTSTSAQPSLFHQPSGSAKEAIDTLSKPVSDAGSVDNSDSLHQSNKINGPETLSKAFRKAWDPDPEQDQDLGSPEEGGSGGGNDIRKKGFVLTVVDGIGFDVDDLIDALAVASGGKFPRALPRESREALQAAIDSAAKISRTPGALVCLREYIARGMEGFPKQPLTADERSRPGGEIAPEVVAAPGWLALAIQHAVAWKQRVDEQVALAAAARKELGFE
jgi:hypothetical protein